MIVIKNIVVIVVTMKLLPILLFATLTCYGLSFSLFRRFYGPRPVKSQPEPVLPCDPIVKKLVNYVVDNINESRKGPFRIAGAIRTAYVVLKQFYELNFDLIYTTCKVGDKKARSECFPDRQEVGANSFARQLSDLSKPFRSLEFAKMSK